MRVSDAVLVGLVGIAVVTFFALRGVARLSWSDEIVYVAMGRNVAAGRGLISNQSLKQAESPETPTYREDGLWTERGRAVVAEALAPILTVHACSESAGSKDHLSRR